MRWLRLYSMDVKRYTGIGKSSPLVTILFSQGLWALLQYRVASGIYQSHLPHPVKKIGLGLCVIWGKLVEVTTGISLPYTAEIDGGFYIGHFGNIIINSGVKIGSNCNISQGVTIGVSGRGDRRGVPMLGCRVYIGANAVVAGKIIIGDDVAIGANSLVTRDVPPHCTVVGVPATVINQHGSAGYINAVDEFIEGE